MSGEDIISKRGTALENQFFAEVDEKLLQALKAELTKADAAKELAKLTGLNDLSVLQGLIEAGLAPTTFPALRLFPLIAVAWSDGRLDAAERDLVLAAADKQGIAAGSASWSILSGWLQAEPAPSLFDAWEGFAPALVAHLSTAEATSLKEAIVAEVRNVAEASGGVLGWASISKGEHLALNRIEKALTRN